MTGDTPGISARSRGLLLASVPALVVDLLVLVLMERVLHVGRAAAIVVAFTVTLVAWAAAGRGVEAVTRRRPR